MDALLSHGTIRDELFGRKNIVLKMLSFFLAFIVLDTLITYYGISLSWVPSYVETNIIYNLYGLDAFLLVKFAVGIPAVYVLYRHLRNRTRYYNAIVLGFASLSWLVVISNLLFILELQYLLLPIASLGLWLHALWWMTRPPM